MNRSDLIEMAYDVGVVRRDVATALVDTVMRVERDACSKLFELYWNDAGLQRAYSPTEYIKTVRGWGSK